MESVGEEAPRARQIDGLSATRRDATREPECPRGTWGG